MKARVSPATFGYKNINTLMITLRQLSISRLPRAPHPGKQPRLQAPAPVPQEPGRRAAPTDALTPLCLHTRLPRPLASRALVSASPLSHPAAGESAPRPRFLSGGTGSIMMESGCRCLLLVASEQPLPLSESSASTRCHPRISGQWRPLHPCTPTVVVSKRSWLRPKLAPTPPPPPQLILILQDVFTVFLIVETVNVCRIVTTLFFNISCGGENQDNPSVAQLPAQRHAEIKRFFYCCWEGGRCKRNNDVITTVTCTNGSQRQPILIRSHVSSIGQQVEDDCVWWARSQLLHFPFSFCDGYLIRHKSRISQGNTFRW
jgi:hypothetical protein